ncbi:MAG: hypothetical protein B7Y35_06135 [Sphingomonadales bacterium 28-64-96]|nr:MAG: hypothetical protein B7Y35_06135 [Sphingomonadales bacterium 28-64-96]
MWIVTRDSDGVIIAGPADEAPTAGEGETLRRVPLSTRWNVTRQVFEDATRWITKFQYVLLWPPEADLAVKQSTDVQMARARSLFEAWEGPINLDDPMVLAGIDRAEAIEILTPTQAQRIKDGLPPL